MNKDLTVGKPSQVLWQFCLPMFGSIIFQQLYNIADSLVAGKFIGENALAAVGNSYEITLIFIAFAFGCNIGCSVIVSRYFGAKEYDDMKTSVYTALIGSAVLCAVLMVFGLLGCRSLLELINTPAEILADSALYLDIYVLGLPFMFFYNIATGIFSALGDSKTPFYFLAVSSLSNISVDILFVAAGGSGNGVFTAAKEAEGVKVIGCDVDQYDDGANGDSNIVLTSGLKVMHDTVYNVLNEVKDGSFKGANVTLTAADDATGFVSEEGRCQLTAEAIEKINAAQALLKEGKIVPAANFNGVTPETFTW